MRPHTRLTWKKYERVIAHMKDGTYESPYYHSFFTILRDNRIACTHWIDNWFHVAILDINTLDILHAAKSDQYSMNHINLCHDGSLIMTGDSKIRTWVPGQDPIKLTHFNGINDALPLKNGRFLCTRRKYNTASNCLEILGDWLSRHQFKKTIQNAVLQQDNIIIQTLKWLYVSTDQAETFQEYRIHGCYSLWHRWDYPIKTQEGWLVRTHKDRQEWAKTLSREFLFLLPELWAIVAMYE
jgi:hypothetical protein